MSAARAVLLLKMKCTRGGTCCWCCIWSMEPAARAHSQRPASRPTRVPSSHFFPPAGPPPPPPPFFSGPPSRAGLAAGLLAAVLRMGEHMLHLSTARGTAGKTNQQPPKLSPRRRRCPCASTPRPGCLQAKASFNPVLTQDAQKLLSSYFQMRRQHEGRQGSRTTVHGVLGKAGRLRWAAELSCMRWATALPVSLQPSHLTAHCSTVFVVLDYFSSTILSVFIPMPCACGCLCKACMLGKTPVCVAPCACVPALRPPVQRLFSTNKTERKKKKKHVHLCLASSALGAHAGELGASGAGTRAAHGAARGGAGRCSGAGRGWRARQQCGEGQREGRR